MKSYVRERMPVAVSRTRRGSNEHLSTLGALYCTQLPGGTTQSKIFSFGFGFQWYSNALPENIK
jgi:hypothetical protein